MWMWIQLQLYVPGTYVSDGGVAGGSQKSAIPKWGTQLRGRRHSHTSITGVGPYKLFFGNNASGNDGEAAAMDVRAHGLGSCGQCYDRCTCVCQRSAYVDWSPIAAKASHPAALGLYYEYRMNDSSSSFPDSDAGEITGPTLQRWPHRCSRSKQNIARCGLRTALSHGTYYRDISKR